MRGTDSRRGEIRRQKPNESVIAEQHIRRDRTPLFAIAGGTPALPA
jgi:hypothetical protein